MAKKDFTMKFAPPNVKGSKRDGAELAATEPAQEPDEKGKNQTDEKPRQEPTELVDSNPAELKEKKGESPSNLLEEPKITNTVFAENPFLQSKEHFDPSSVIKTGYKMRIEYKQTLKLLAEIKKGYTIEALLDDALTMYLSSNPEAQKAISMMRMMK